VNALDESGMAALHYAARANHFEAVALLIKKANAGLCDTPLLPFG
jgi:ankyrin repeat protein